MIDIYLQLTADICNCGLRAKTACHSSNTMRACWCYTSPACKQTIIEIIFQYHYYFQFFKLAFLWSYSSLGQGSKRGPKEKGAQKGNF